jgi:hypothetical protein
MSLKVNLLPIAGEHRHRALQAKWDPKATAGSGGR